MTNPKQYGADPATFHFTATANSSNLFVTVPRAIYCQSTGNVEIADSGNTFIVYAVTAGQTLPFRATRFGANSTANVVFWY